MSSAEGALEYRGFYLDPVELEPVVGGVEARFWSASGIDHKIDAPELAERVAIRARSTTTDARRALEHLVDELRVVARRQPSEPLTLASADPELLADLLAPLRDAGLRPRSLASAVADVLREESVRPVRSVLPHFSVRY